MSTPADRIPQNSLVQAQIRAFQKDRLAMGNQLNIDADRAMRSLAVGQHTGMALNLIDANLEELEEELKKSKDFDPDAWKRESPGYAAYAAENPYHLSVLKLDNENLTKWERNWRGLTLSLDSTWAKVEYNYINKRRAHGIFYDTDMERLAEYEKWLQPHTFGAESLWAKAVVLNAKEVGPMWYAIRNTPDEIALGIAAGMLTYGLAAAPLAAPTLGWSEALGLTAGAISGAYAGWNVGLMRGSYDMITGESYGRYIKAGFSHENAAIAAKAAGVAGAVAEPFGINMLFKYFPGARKLVGKGAQALTEKLTGQVLARQSVKKATGVLMLRYGEVMGSEIAVEIYQDSMMTVGQNILSMVEEKPDAYIDLPEWRNQMADTFVETAKAISLIAGVGPGLSYVGDFVSARRAGKLEVAFKALGEAAKDSKLRKSVPARFRDFVDKAAGSVKHILLNVEGFDTYFQGIGMDPDKIAADLGIKPKDLEHARTHTKFLEIEVGTFAEKVAPSEHYAELSQHLKTDMEPMTNREYKDFLANASELERAWALGEPPDVHTPVQAIVDRMRNELMAGGRHDFSAASKLAALEEYRFSIMAEKAGLDPLEFFESKFGGIQREIETTGEKIDVDYRIDPLLDLLRAEKGPRQKEMYGDTLIEWLIKKGGLQEEGGELGAMDAAKEFAKLVQASGLTHDEAAELAVEAGFIAERDPEMLREAVRNEIAGKPIYGIGGDPASLKLGKDLDELFEFLEQNDLDVQAMTNLEIRTAIRGDLTLYQDDIIEVPGALPDNIIEEQDFGELQIVMDMEITGRPGEIVGISRSANAAYQTAKDRLRSMQDLLECLNAA